MTTEYSFHHAYDHAIIGTATPGSLQIIAAQIAAMITGTGTNGGTSTQRVYVHNGLGIVGAGLCRNGLWTDILRDDYRQFDDKARTEREQAGLTNDAKQEA